MEDSVMTNSLQGRNHGSLQENKMEDSTEHDNRLQRRNQEGEDTRTSVEKIMQELKQQGAIGGPIAAMNLMWFGRMVISTAFLGHQGDLQLAGGALALTFANVTGFSILNGLAGGMEAICSQAYGAGKMKLLGTTLYRAMILLLLSSIPIAALWLNMEKVLLLLGQHPDICRVSGVYLRYMLPDLIAMSIVLSLRVYMRSQCITNPMMVCSLVTMVLHVPINLYMIRYGVSGTAISVCWSDFNDTAMMVAYVVVSGLGKTTHETNWWRTCTGLMPLVRLSLSSCLMTCLEWWCYEILVLLTGRLPDAKSAVAALAIALNLDQLLYSVMISLSCCVSTRVGNELGARRPRAASLAATVAVGASVCVAAVGSTGMLTGRSKWARIFSRDRAVRKVAEKAMLVMGPMEMFNFPLAVAGGVLRGTARPSVAVWFNLGAFYLLGLPAGAVMAFKWKMGLLGLLVGIFGAVCLCAALTVACVLRTDWNKQAGMAQRLTKCQVAEGVEKVAEGEGLPCVTKMHGGNNNVSQENV